MSGWWLEYALGVLAFAVVAHYDRRVRRLEDELRSLRAVSDNAYGSARLALDKIAEINGRNVLREGDWFGPSGSPPPST